MSFVRVEDWRDQVIGLKPLYTDTGNATQIINASGDTGLDRRVITTVQAALARAFAVDLKAQHDHIRAILKRKSLLPFYLPGPRVFIPLKMRQAIAVNDSTYGYIDVSFIDKVVRDEEKNTCIVDLTTGQKVEVLSNRTTIISSQHLGQELLAYLQPPGNVSGEDEIIKSVTIILSYFNRIQDQLTRIERRL